MYIETLEHSVVLYGDVSAWQNRASIGLRDLHSFKPVRQPRIFLGLDALTAIHKA